MILDGGPAEKSESRMGLAMCLRCGRQWVDDVRGRRGNRDCKCGGAANWGWAGAVKDALVTWDEREE